MTLKISNDVSLPIDAVTQTFGILAMKGRGKSYTASVMAEEMLKAKQQVVVLDPTGAWWGLQSSADGKKAGYPVVIFGGDHGNVPLEENAGEIIAQALVDQRFSAIIDLSLFRKAAMKRFVASFLETLYRINREAVHLFVDEADLFAPQKSFGDEARTLGAMEDIVRRGRKRGIGCTMITQRPASINKDVLTQCEILIALGLNHPRDIGAIEEWVKVNATISQAEKMIKSLPSMPIGTAWIWSPSWLDIFKTIKVRKRETFDSGATPKPGERVIAPKKLAEIDIKTLGEKITQTIEKKKQDDPAALRKKIMDLEKQLQQKDKVKPEVVVDNSKEITALNNTISILRKLLSKYRNLAMTNYAVIKTTVDEIDEQIPKYNTGDKDFSAQNSQSKTVVLVKPSKSIPFDHVSNKSRPIDYIPKRTDPDYDKGTPLSQHIHLGKCEKAILSVLGQREGQNSSKEQIGILSGYSPNSGSFNNSLGKLRSLGFIQGSGDSIKITEEGLLNAGPYEVLPTGVALHLYWINKLPKCESKILEHLIDQYPEPCSKEQIGQASGYSPGSGSFNNALGKLRTLELIHGRGAENIKASDNLF